MDERRLALFRDLQDLYVRLLECYDLAEELRHVPRLSVEIDEALAGLHYSVAKATQDAGTLLQDARLWEPS